MELGHTWYATNVLEDLPSDSIVAGHDSDGDTIYVGRAYHNGDVLPAKVIPNKKKAYISWGGMEHEKHDVELLTGQYYVWKLSSPDSVPSSAVCVGKTAEGEPLYVGRTQWEGSMTPGKIQMSHKCLYIPYGGVEHRVDDGYEILIHPETWMSTSGNNLVNGAISAGTDVDGDLIYIARAFHNGEILPAKAIPSKGCAYVCYGGEEHVKFDYELLVGYGYGWVEDRNGGVPNEAVICSQTSDGEPLYIGRGHWGGSLTLGKIHPSHGCLYIPFSGKEVRIHDYEVLVRRELY